MNLAVTIGAGVAGVAAGWGGGFLGVQMERLEGLQKEEAEERAEYEAGVAAKAVAARAAGEEPPASLPWRSEHYGWTWLERYLAPVLGAVCFALLASRHGLTWRCAEDLLWTAVFVHIITLDLKHGLILDLVTYPAFVVALVLAAVTPGLSVLQAVIGAAVMGVFFLICHLAYPPGIGLGDVKLVALIGAVTGLGAAHYAAFDAVFLGVFLGGFAALILLVTRVRSRKEGIAYGPFLCAGALVVLYLTL
jgi:prepilin signal peptidase PulO-like enzyme (type II secretory pathway)